MTVQEYLSKAYRLDNHIDVEIQCVEQLRRKLYSLGGVSDDTPVQHSGQPYAGFTSIVEKIVDAEREINAMIDRYANIKKDIERLISTLEDDESQVILKYRYLCRHSWEEIAKRTFVSATTVRRKHDAAIEELEKVFPAFLEEVGM